MSAAGKYFAALIEQGEHDQQDFKFAINDSKKIARSIAAFANTKSGRLRIGVKDNGNIAGIKTHLADRILVDLLTANLIRTHITEKKLHFHSSNQMKQSMPCRMFE